MVFYPGAAAIEESEAFHPHIIFSDIGLPRMNGLTLASRLLAKFRA